jgi:hypothetical protein
MLTTGEKITNRIMKAVEIDNEICKDTNVPECHDVEYIKQTLEQDCVTYNDFLQVVKENILGEELENYIIKKALNRNVD